MKRSMKKIFAGILAATLIVVFGITSMAADTTDTGTGTVNGTVTVNGSINALTISVTHPLNVAYAIDPNSGASGTFTAPDIAIKNNTKVPVNVTVNSLTAASGGTTTFTDVLPSAKTWSALNTTDSKKYIALGILIKSATGWNTGYATTTMYAASGTPTMFGTLPAAATGTFTLTANYGLAFDGAYTANHSLVFMFQLN
ncbi:MAG: hypothetical protein ABF449_02595 [Ethanoligenens sp.]